MVPGGGLRSEGAVGGEGRWLLSVVRGLVQDILYSMEDRYTTITVPKTLKKLLKILAAERGISLSKLIEELYAGR